MVDTINLRIHNVKKYKLLYEQFLPSARNKNAVVEGQTIIDEDGVVTEKERVWGRIVAFEDTGKFIPHVNRFDVTAPSSVYHVRGAIRDMAGDKAFLEIEFSIPKYFYATNVFQFLGSPPQSSEANYHQLIKGIDRFMRNTFSQVPKKTDIEIFRLDMCYNQFHKTKADAMEFLSAQRDHMKQFADGRSMRFVDTHETTWTLLTQRYSFKCYHKGTEFAKNDAPQLVKTLAKHKYNVAKLQEVADCILRYEITYRHTMIQYLTMYYTFQDMEKKKPFLFQSPLYEQMKRLSKAGGQFAKYSEQLDIPTKGMTPIDFFVSKQKRFCLRSPFDGIYSPVNVFSDTVTFNYPVYRLLFDWFWERVRQSQPEESVPVFKMVERINIYQEKLQARKDKGVYEAGKVKNGNLRAVGSKSSARMLVPALLSQFVDLRQLKDFLPPATYYRLVKDFKLAGLPLKSTMSLVQRPPLDYAMNAALLEPMKSRNYIL